MSRFDDLDDHVRREEEARENLRDEFISRINKEGARYLPQLQRVYSVVGDYYKTIIQPKGYTLYPRKKEGPTQGELEKMHYETTLFAYVANVLSPQDQRPYADDDRFCHWAYPSIGEMDQHEWHPNISLHVSASITSHDLEAKDVELDIFMRAWGFVEGNADSLITKGITTSTQDGGWSHYSTNVMIEPDEKRIENQVEAGLRLLTPNIIHHKEVFNKTYI